MKKSLVFSLILIHYFTLNAQLANFSEIASISGLSDILDNQGVSCIDYDKDGDEDIYFSVRQGPNMLYQNQGDGTFIDVAAAAGVDFPAHTFSGIWGDINNDGWDDLYLANYNLPNLLYLNNGDGTFTNISPTSGIMDAGRAQAAMFGDVNKDGWLDIYVANLWTQNVLYINNGDNTFTNATFSSQVEDMNIAMGAIFFDYDNDDDLDLYLTHDNNQPNILYQNDGTGVFSDVSEISGMNVAGYCMGVETADFNRDGYLDVYIANLGSNYLLMNNGNGTFTEVGEVAGVDDGGMGWGVSCFDYDNDGWTDIYMSNNSSFAPNPNVLYKNMGDGTFNTVSSGTVLASMRRGYGTSCVDIDNNGFIDLILANTGTDANEVFKNNHIDNNWIAIKTVGSISNKSAIGTRVEVHTGDIKQIDEVMGGSGWASQNSLILHFGLGTTTKVDSMVLKWPNGLVETYYNLEVNQKYIVEENNMPSSSTHQEDNIQRLEIFPNPVSNQFSIELELKQKRNIQIDLINVYGNIIQQWINPRQPNGEISLQWQRPTKLPNGIYYLRIQLDKKHFTRKLVFIE